jgi:hypothetical protein
VGCALLWDERATHSPSKEIIGNILFIVNLFCDAKSRSIIPPAKAVAANPKKIAVFLAKAAGKYGTVRGYLLGTRIA